MESFRFYHPIAIRYGDLDAQRHVNNARYFTYMEEARIQYIQHLELWDGSEFEEIGFILLETNCQFKAPIRYGQRVRVGVKTVRMGNKSMELESVLEDPESSETLASGRSTLVAYDYSAAESIPIPDNWRTAIENFEGD